MSLCSLQHRTPKHSRLPVHHKFLCFLQNQEKNKMLSKWKFSLPRTLSFLIELRFPDVLQGIVLEIFPFLVWVLFLCLCDFGFFHPGLQKDSQRFVPPSLVASIYFSFSIHMNWTHDSGKLKGEKRVKTSLVYYP